jgi:GT2 family glycosyltransferase
MPEPKVLIAIVTYNALQWLDFCLAPFASLPDNWQVLVVDNASSDGTADAIRSRYPWVRLVENVTNLGFGRGNNIALRMALDEGVDHVFLLNQDACASVEDIRLCVRVQRECPELFIVSPMQMNGSGDDCDLGFQNTCCAPASCPGLLGDALRGELLPVYRAKKVFAASWLLSRQCLMTIGGFNPIFFHYAEDDDYTNRVRYHGYGIGLVPGAFMRHDRVQKIRTRPYGFRFYRSLTDLVDPRGNDRNIVKTVWRWLLFVLRNLWGKHKVLGRHYGRELVRVFRTGMYLRKGRNPSASAGPTWLF